MANVPRTLRENEESWSPLESVSGTGSDSEYCGADLLSSRGCQDVIFAKLSENFVNQENLGS